jgi:hypothetical protein
MLTPIHIKLALVVDATASMEGWIHTLKTSVSDLTEIIHGEYPNASMDMALVAYRECDDSPRYRVVDFTDPATVEDALQSCVPSQGYQGAGNVAGALERVARLTWDSGIPTLQLVIHVTGRPPHGMRYHSVAVEDRFPGGDPRGRDPLESMRELNRLGVRYLHLQTSPEASLMVDEFRTVWEGHRTTCKRVEVTDRALVTSIIAQFLWDAVWEWEED